MRKFRFSIDKNVKNNFTTLFFFCLFPRETSFRGSPLFSRLPVRMETRTLVVGNYDCVLHSNNIATAIGILHDYSKITYRARARRNGIEKYSEL